MLEKDHPMHNKHPNPIRCRKILEEKCILYPRFYGNSQAISHINNSDIHCKIHKSHNITPIKALCLLTQTKYLSK